MRTVFLSVWHNNARSNLRSIYKDKWASWSWTTEFDLINPIIDLVIKSWVPWYTLHKVPTGLNINARVNYVNSKCKDWDILLEFHADSSPASVTEWCTTFYYDGSEYAKRKAISFQKEYTRVSWIKGRWVKWDLSKIWWLWIVRRTKPLALLVELGFITNQTEVRNIRNKAVASIVAWIINII